tara:strand:- start:394 stop:1683 length:1290 start_codon:yes stop_codon:yes gene_type:complete
MNKYKIILYILCVSFSLVNGQVNTYSPYSYFALGQLHPIGNNYNISMGGLGTSVNSNQYLNYINPASYAFLDITTFEFGMRSSFINMSQKLTDSQNVEQNNFVSGLTSIGLGFPISRKVSLSASLFPYTSVGYSMMTDEVIFNQTLTPQDSIAASTTLYSGSGGINKFLLGISVNILDNLSLGASFNYLFGSIKRETRLSSNQSPWYFRDISEKILRGSNFDIGLLYFKMIDDYKINIGFTIRPAKDINTQRSILQVMSGEVYSSDNPINLDLLDENTGNNNTHLPLESSIGVSIQANEKWLIGLDYRYNNWENYDESNINVCCMQNSNEFIFGGFYTPNKDDIYNYFNRVQYRFGASYSSGYLDPLTHFSGTLGLGLPINRVSSKANIAFKYGVITSDLNQNDFMEQYFSIYLSMTLNEKWFQKLKIQ